MPKISVVIPTYNSLESFKRVFDSIMLQNFQDYEIIVSDDSTNDEIGIFLKGISNPKVKYFKNETPLGPPENWNEGIRKASGEYIKIIHHDDWLANKDALGKFVKLMENNPQSIFGYSKSVNVDIESGKKKYRSAEKYVKLLEKNPFELLTHNRIGAPSVCIFRNGLDLFFDKNIKWVVDIDFYITILQKNNNIAFIKEELVNIGIQKNRVTDFCEANLDLIASEELYLKNKFNQ